MRRMTPRRAIEEVRADLMMIESGALIFAYENFEQFMRHMDIEDEDAKEWGKKRLYILVMARTEMAREACDALGPDYVSADAYRHQPPDPPAESTPV